MILCTLQYIVHYGVQKMKIRDIFIIIINIYFYNRTEFKYGRMIIFCMGQNYYIIIKT